MGWTNYIIIPKLKLAVETTRHVDENFFPDWQTFKKLLDTADEMNHKYFEENIKNFSIKDLSAIVNFADKAMILQEFDYDLLLLLWLESKRLNYEIVSEFEFKKEKYEEKGFTILRIEYGDK